MKICIISTRFPPYNVGGEEIYAKRLYDSLKADKNNEVYSINNTVGGSFEDKNVINLNVGNNIYLSALGIPDPFLYIKLRRLIDRLRPDIIHINNPHSTISTEPFFLPLKYPKVWEIHDYGLFCFAGTNIHNNKPCYGSEICIESVHEAVAKGLTKRKNLLNSLFLIIWNTAGSRLIDSILYRLKRWIVTKAANRVNMIICPGTNVKTTCLKYGISEKKLVFIPYGINLKKYKAQPLPYKKTVGFVGRLEKIKGADVLINAFKEVVSQAPNSHLFLVGSGSQQADLRDLVKKLNLANHVTFLGGTTPDRLVDFYPRMQFLVAPSTWMETPSLVVMECMASGRPVIASDVGDYKDIVKDGVNGYLFKTGSSHDLALKIIQMQNQRAKVLRMAKGARRTMHMYSQEIHVRRITNLYKKLLLDVKL
ncbi:MAG: group 1 glycosyl transferase [Microgenomates group bacterium GW2011_GWA2_44_7]|nr:MAG: group 1 glycosyl transferase [Microgenomates group bacterium GW2011_GWA2_44_7]KKT78613.1 MAG: group 1 glycosyl transferase [Microgenomates group bacterium GW2011_GWB1_44_8]